MRFDWNEAKARSNKAKHGVSFDEAKTVFSDPRRLTEFDVEHSAGEDRFIVIGMSVRLRVLTVVIVERHEDVLRIISARKATRAERRRYEAQA